MEMKTLKNLVTGSNGRNLLFLVLIGMFIGYGYYFFIGCNTGSCAITSDPIKSTLYGGLFGMALALFVSKDEPTSFLPKKKS